MSNNNIKPSLFLDDDFEEVKLIPEKVRCLGMEFENEDARRAYFREELRKKLPELKQIEGFPIGEDDDIINLSDPPYYTACPNPWLNDFIQEWEKEKVELEKEGKRKKNFEVKVPYASDVSEGKSNPVYTAHTYHTKVPHPAIMRYLLHYTQPGDIILDAFAGTGMTGVAAQACKAINDEYHSKITTEYNELFGKEPIWGERHAICGDLSPYASMVSYNYNTPVNAILLKKEAERIFTEVEEECSWLYETMHEGKPIGRINYMVWSDVIICSNCRREFVYWDAAIDKENKCLKDDFRCPHCGCLHTKKKAERAFERYYDKELKDTIQSIKHVPAILVYSVNGKRYEKNADQFDIDKIKEIYNYNISTFIPIEELPDGYNTEQPKRTQGFYHIHQFYTRRNLITLSVLFDKIQKSLLPNKLKFLFTGMINRSTKMNRVHINNYFYGGGGWNAGHLKGTLYIPSLPVETSVLEQIHDKLNLYLRAMPLLPDHYGNGLFVASAENTTIKDNSIDYIFTDPPFGANINYSELNFLPESWLKVITNNRTEAIENQAQGKNKSFYYDEMQKCFAEYYRVLRPGKWMTVEFSNTSAAIWNFIQRAITSAGFVIAKVSGLDKKQGGIRSITTSTAVRQDLAISCYKPSQLIFATDSSILGNNVWSFVEEHLNHLPIYILKNTQLECVIERDKRILYDRVISYFVQHGYAIPMDAQEFQIGLRERFIERDGMFFTASQALEYEEKKKETNGIIPMALFISSEAEGIEWLKRELETPQTYSEIQPEWMKAMSTTKKGDVLPELMTILEENFIKDEDGKWRKPDPEKVADLEIIRNRKMMKEFNMYLEQAQKPKAKRMKDTRLEVLRYGFKECYKQKDYKSIILVGDHIQESLLQEDEVLLQYYDIASTRV